MKTCYIAGKISNLPELEYKSNFRKAKEFLTGCGFTVISPIELTHNHGGTWSEYMVEDLTHMLRCDAVYALNNWRDSKGAKIEIQLAEALGKKVLYQPLEL